MPHLVEIIFFITWLKKITCSLGHIPPIIAVWAVFLLSIATLSETLTLSFNSFEVCLKFGQMSLH